MLATGILFRRDRKGRFIPNAKKLQDILMYSLKVEKNKQFDQTELSNSLADDYSLFGFDRNTPKKVKRHKISGEIDLLIEPLINLGLVNKTWPESESNVNKELILLQYTKAGLLLALIIDSFDLERRLEDNRKIYEILQTYHSTNKSSKHQFFVNLLTIYHQQDNLDDLTEIVRKALESTDYIPVTNLMDIYEIVTVICFTDLEKAKVFVSNWKSALNNLELPIRSVFLYNIKLEFEAKMGDCKDLGDPILYEKYRFDLRGDPEETALQARWNKCDIVQNLPYRTSDLINLMIRRLNGKPLTLTIKCPSCNDFNCLVIPCL